MSEGKHALSTKSLTNLTTVLSLTTSEMSNRQVCTTKVQFKHCMIIYLYVNLTYLCNDSLNFRGEITAISVFPIHEFLQKFISSLISIGMCSFVTAYQMSHLDKNLFSILCSQRYEMSEKISTPRKKSKKVNLRPPRFYRPVSKSERCFFSFEKFSSYSIVELSFDISHKLKKN